MKQGRSRGDIGVNGGNEMGRKIEEIKGKNGSKEGRKG